MQHVAVAWNSSGAGKGGGGGAGWLSFLSLHDGSEEGRAELGGTVRAAPVVDPWQGLVWVPTHSRRLCLCQAPGVRLPPA